MHHHQIIIDNNTNEWTTNSSWWHVEYPETGHLKRNPESLKNHDERVEANKFSAAFAQLKRSE